MHIVKRKTISDGQQFHQYKQKYKYLSLQIIEHN
jgi:hypothetical protein